MVRLSDCTAIIKYGINSIAGATNYGGEIVFTSEGQGNDTASALVVMSPREPYNTTGELNGWTFVDLLLNPLKCSLTTSLAVNSTLLMT